MYNQETFFTVFSEIDVVYNAVNSSLKSGLVTQNQSLEEQLSF